MSQKGNSELSAITVHYAQHFAAGLFKEVGIESCLLDAQLLLAHVLQKSRIDIQLARNLLLNKTEEAQFFSLLARRLTFEPMAYILGKKEFYGRDFVVSKDCLIPRPDTETIVEKCLELISDNICAVFDLCTGSGAIVISLLCERANLNAYATDICPKALSLALDNAKKHHVSDRVSFLCGDLLAPLTTKADLIVANPPYIKSDVIAQLSPEVRDHEPKIALDGLCHTGMGLYKRILNDAVNYIHDKGYLVMEIGFDQEAYFKDIITADWRIVEFFLDLAGNARGIVLQKNEQRNF